MTTKAQILSREMILPAYKAAMLTSFIFSYFLLSSLYICRETSTNPHSFFQNKPNLPENQVNASSVLTKGYEADIVFWPENPKANLPENQVNASSVLTKGYEADIVFWPENPKPNSNPIHQMPEMNVTKVLTEDYEENSPGWLRKNKPNSNPISIPKNPSLFIMPRDIRMLV